MRDGVGIELELQFSPKMIAIIRIRWNVFEIIKAGLDRLSFISIDILIDQIIVRCSFMLVCGWIY